MYGPGIAFPLFFFLLIFTNNSKLNKHPLVGREVALRKKRQGSEIKMLGSGVECNAQERMKKNRV